MSTPPYVVFYCHPTLDSTPSYLSLLFILPQLTTSYPVAPSYPILHCSLLPSYLTSNPVPNFLHCILLLAYLRGKLRSYSTPTPHPTLSHLPTQSYSVFYCHPTSHPTLAYSILPHITTSYLVLPCPTSSYSILPHPTPSYTGFSCHPTPSYLILPHLTTSTWEGSRTPRLGGSTTRFLHTVHEQAEVHASCDDRAGLPSALACAL